ncbi:pentapeptide repeat-containing protein [Streptomyces sp. NPDC048523]|uniref:pentapeptide repeat-containing protein n=1 Tax=Streptomyces sp. NPDC048523 TaxID=3365567 RepID=UPI00371D41AE
MSTSEPPTWPHCAHDADPAANPVGCHGIHVPGHTVCLAHLADADRDAYLAGLTPGADIDHRGTRFTGALLGVLLAALCDPTTGQARLGTAEFAGATFEGGANFGSAAFEGDAGFVGTTFKRALFQGDADFARATFERVANFGSATFEGDAGFVGTTFKRALFQGTTFEGNADFARATFERGVEFRAATFEGDAGFRAATFKGVAMFQSATFERGAWFRSLTFEGDADFARATFERVAMFQSATFEGRAMFRAASFKGDAGFQAATFEGNAVFESATFEGGAEFRAATFARGAGFRAATFARGAEFQAATFMGNARFESATFKEADQLGPLACTGRVVLSGAVFGGPVTLLFVAHRLECRRTRWSSTAEIRLRYATVDFAHAVFEYPLTIAAEPDPFVFTDGRQLDEDPFRSTPDLGARVASLHGVDAAHLVLADLDLSGCLFAGTVHLDQLRLEGACTFDTAPPAVHWWRWPPVRFTERRVLAEEHHWRAGQPGALRGWNVAVLDAGRAGPLQLAPVYRALRKSFEDGKHEPGAADFYYGEMEMRRHADDIPRGEQRLLTVYWALSGYGLRASRALAWLGAAMLLTIVLLMAVGLAKDTPKQTATGTIPVGGGKVTFEIDKDDPQNPTGNRFTGERFEKALNVTLNSVVFRASGQDLTTAGTYIEMTSRLTEPVLLGLAVLAVRNRVKR